MTKHPLRLRVTVSGSFNRHLAAVYEAVQTFRELGADVVSPADPVIVDKLGDFLFVASDRVRSVKLVQDRHLHSIRASSFLWLVCPEGYVGQSASMEIGAAVSCGVPIFAARAPADQTLQEYVIVVENEAAALRKFGESSNPVTTANVILYPDEAVEIGHMLLDQVRTLLTTGQGGDSEQARLFDELTAQLFVLLAKPRLRETRATYGSANRNLPRTPLSLGTNGTAPDDVC